jgi:hypothetical protein
MAFFCNKTLMMHCYLDYNNGRHCPLKTLSFILTWRKESIMVTDVAQNEIYRTAVSDSI